MDGDDGYTTDLTTLGGRVDAVWFPDSALITSKTWCNYTIATLSIDSIRVTHIVEISSLSVLRQSSRRRRRVKLLIQMQHYAGDRWLNIKAHTNRPSSATSSSSHHQQTISRHLFLWIYYLNSTNLFSLHRLLAERKKEVGINSVGPKKCRPLSSLLLSASLSESHSRCRY